MLNAYILAAKQIHFETPNSRIVVYLRETDWIRCPELSLPINRVRTAQSPDSERARDQWQCAAVTPQVNLSFSFVYCGIGPTAILFKVCVCRYFVRLYNLK